MKATSNVTEVINSLTTENTKINQLKKLEITKIKANALITSLSEQKYNQIKKN
ncbi:hypothetical protein NWQ33_00670 [Mycoplasmopsis cynos]|nr:hypothetical protein [Mycoplasmopsis cynos]